VTIEVMGGDETVVGAGRLTPTAMVTPMLRYVKAWPGAGVGD
jgi:hypothetical protein